MAEEVLDPVLEKIKTTLTLFALVEGGFVSRFIKAFNVANPKLAQRPLRDSRPGFEGWTLLHHAAMLGDPKVVAFLAERGHAIDIIDSSLSCMTPLMVAIAFDRVSVANELITLGADPSATDMSGDNAIHYAARVSGTMIKEIIKSGNFSSDHITALVTTPNCKRKFPEDISANDVVKETLMNFRCFGYIPTKVRHLPSKRMKNKLVAA